MLLATVAAVFVFFSRHYGGAAASFSNCSSTVSGLTTRFKVYKISIVIALLSLQVGKLYLTYRLIYY